MLIIGLWLKFVVKRTERKYPPYMVFWLVICQNLMTLIGHEIFLYDRKSEDGYTTWLSDLRKMIRQ